MIRFLLLLSVILIFPACHAQQQFTTRSKKAIKLFQEADNYRVRGQYGQAVQLLNEALEKDDEFAEAWFMLGLTYKMAYKLDDAVRCFERSIATFPAGTSPLELHFELGQVYMYEGQYEKARNELSGYLNRGGVSSRNANYARKAVIDANYALEHLNDHSSIDPRDLGETVNSFNMQYFPVLTADQRILIYTKRGPSDDEDLVVSFRDNEGEWSAPSPISRNINTASNEGTCTISADASVLIFTSCQGRETVGSCDLYLSRRTGNEWSPPQNMGVVVNSPYWDSQPSLSADGRTLYFISERPGGIGGKDIWITHLEPDGTWSKPINAGEGINTPFDELSPFIHANNSTLYFASNGYPGFGGNDIYYTELRENWPMPKNLGYPVNTSKDQVALFITADGKKAYYSDEKAGGSGLDSRLYEFDLPEDMQVTYRTNYIYGRVLDQVTNEPVEARVELFNLSDDEPVSLMNSDPVNGNYLMVLPEGATYALYIEGEGYMFESLNFDYRDTLGGEPVYRDILLKKVSSGDSVVLNNLFFDLGKYDLRPESRVELNKVVQFLRDNPAIRLMITGHTDDTGTREINEELSANRALAVVSYLANAGIDRERLQYEGMADKDPIFPNTTDENRAKNRRIEMEIR